MSPSEEMKVKVCLVGEGEVGKTSLIRRFVYDEFDDRYITTMGAKVSKKTLVVRNGNGDRVTMNMAIWDIMGQQTFRDIMKEAFFYGAHGILAVCDITSEQTLYELDGWVKDIKKVTGDIPLQFLGNKVDLMNDMAVDESALGQFARKHGAPYTFTSAKTGENVPEAFQKLAKLIAE